MKKFLKWTLVVVVSLVALLFITFMYLNSQSRKKSPESTAIYDKAGTKITVAYSSPGRRDREIFGALVPYGAVWRTGANEATTFETNKDLTIDGKPLPAGKYTLWTIPEKDNWTVIWNKKQYPWGIKGPFDRSASREPMEDALQTVVPVEVLPEPLEHFTISFTDANEGIAMALAWDKVKVVVPIK